MNSEDYEIAQELKQKLSTIVQLVDFRIFGSRARGDADEASDLDVFVEVETLDKELKKKIRAIVWEVGFEHALYIAPLIFTRYEIEESPLRVSPIVRNITDEGVKV